MWNELTFLWNELTILWNDLTTDWNDLTWNDLTGYLIACCNKKLQHDNDMTACLQNKNRRLLRRWSLSLSQKMYA